VKLVFPLGSGASLWVLRRQRWGEWLAVAALGGLLQSGQQNRTNGNEKSLQSVSNSETDVTVNLTSFEELLVSQTTQKAQQNSWKDPSKNWGQNEGLQRAGGQENKGGNR